MSRADAPVSLADLAAAGVRLRPFEVVTIVRELAQQVARGEAAGVPSAHVIRLSPSGSVFIEGPVAAGGRSVARAAQLLEALLPAFDAPPEFRAPGGLRLVVARALGTVDLPPYATLEAMSDALARFAAPETAVVVRQLVASWAESVAAKRPEDDLEVVRRADADADVTESVLESFAPAVPMPTVGKELTVSDVRRARRATGLTLTQLGERSRIPVALLRELEWGYLRNWPAGHYGRTQLVRYARAAGLDEDVVVRTVWPLLIEESSPTGVSIAPDRVRVDERTHEANQSQAFPVSPTLLEPRAKSHSTRGARVLAALAIPALLAVAIAPAFWHRATTTVVNPPAPAAPAKVVSEPVSVPAPGARTPNAPAATREPDHLVPPAVPAAGSTSRHVSTLDPAAVNDSLSDAPIYSPAFPSVGSAIFYQGDADSNAPDHTSTRAPVLRITRIVDDSARNFHVRTSPDGLRIAFDSDRDGERAVYIADANGQRVRRVSGEGFGAVPSWAPDSASLLFVKSEPGKPEVWNLWAVDLSTGAARRLTGHSAGQPWGASWFPDGQRIAYGVDDRLIVLDVQTGAERVYHSPRKGRHVRIPSVSPDGRRIVFQVDRDGAWLLELKEGSMRKILSDPTTEEYTWAPDGSRIAYHSRRADSWAVWIMAPR